jgi:hypothetical protein
VKTFLTKEEMILQEQHWETKKLTEYHLVGVELPYNLVDATAVIDIWVFGVIVLYSLVTHLSLFPLNLDDDLSDATAMKNLCEWDKVKQMTKLKLINDPLAHKLLMKILSPKPSDRYHSMELLLRDDYFDAKNLTEHVFDSQKKMVDAIRKQTVELRNTKKQIIAKISRSASVTLTAIFDANEVQTPTCFVILPENLHSSSLSKTGDMTKAMESKMEYIGDVLDKATDCIASPFNFGAAFLNCKFIESTMFLYLVDESTGKPVWVDGGVYPVKIDVRSEQAEKFLPLLALGMQILGFTNTVIGIISMFYPALPSGVISKDLWDKASRFIEESEKSGIINQVVEQGSTENETVRGEAVRGEGLREFVAFLEEKDPTCTFSGLTRICDKSSGKAMWVTKESANEITDENEAAYDNAEEEDNWPRIENQQLVGEIRRLEAALRAEEDSRPMAEIPNVEEDNRLSVEKQQHADDISRLTAAHNEEVSRLIAENHQQTAGKCCAIS